MKENNKDILVYDAVIIGYGLVGSITAAILSSYGLKTLVLEQKEKANLLVSKTSRIDNEALRILRELGYYDAIKHLIQPLKGNQIKGKNDKVFLNFEHSSVEGLYPLYSFYQPDVQAVLQREIEKQASLDIELGALVSEIEEEEEGSCIYINYTKDQDAHQVIGKYLLVCNGAGSSIPDQFDLLYKDYKYNSNILCVDTISTDSLKYKEAFASTVCDTSIPVTRIRTSANSLRWEFLLDGRELNENTETVNKLLEEHIPSGAELKSAFVYDFSTRVLEDWRRERVFILGDAAHIMPPYLGVGFSAGVKDAYNLAWKLHLVLEKDCNEGEILDSYTLERKKDIEHLIRLNLQVKRMLNAKHWRFLKYFASWMPRFLLKRNISSDARVQQGIVDAKKYQAGRLLPMYSVLGTNKRNYLFEQILGTQFAVVALNENPVDAIPVSQLCYLANLNCRFIEVVPKRNQFLSSSRFALRYYDQTEELEEWMKNGKITYIIVRPDKTIFATAKTKEELQRSLTILQNQIRIKEKKYSSIKAV